MKILGWDFGTTTTVLAIAEDNGRIRVLLNSGKEGKPVDGFPSLAVYASRGKWICGTEAVTILLEKGSKNVPHFVELKRFISSGVGAECRTEVYNQCMKVLQSTCGGNVKMDVDGSVSITLGEETLSVHDVLKQIAAAAVSTFKTMEGLSGDDVCVCATYPAHFNLRQRFILRNILQQGGSFTDCRGFMMADEASAAVAGALYLGMDLGTSGLVMVLDMGGGTFDVSLLEMRIVGLVTTLTVHDLGGCPTVAGKDFKEKLRAMAPGASELALEDAMRALSSEDAPVRIACRESGGGAEGGGAGGEGGEEGGDAGGDAGGVGGEQQAPQVTRQAFEQACAPLVAQLKAAAQDVLDGWAERGGRDGQPAEPLACVLLCGGASRIPMVRAMAQEVASAAGCKLEVVAADHAAHLVAYGAAAIAQSNYSAAHGGAVAHTFTLKASSMRPFHVETEGDVLMKSADQTDEAWNQQLMTLKGPHTTRAAYHRAVVLAKSIRSTEGRSKPHNDPTTTEDEIRNGFLYNMEVLLPPGWVIGSRRCFPDQSDLLDFASFKGYLTNAEKTEVGYALWSINVFEGFQLSSHMVYPVGKMQLKLRQEVADYYAGRGAKVVEEDEVKVVMFASLADDGTLTIQIKYMSNQPGRDGRVQFLTFSDTATFEVTGLSKMDELELAQHLQATSTLASEQVYDRMLKACELHATTMRCDVFDEVFGPLLASSAENKTIPLEGRMRRLNEYVVKNRLHVQGYQAPDRALVRIGADPSRKRRASSSHLPSKEAGPSRSQAP